MDEVHLVSRVAALTGRLSPTSRTPRGALDRARRFITEALLNGQSEPMQHPRVIEPSTAELDELAPETRADSQRVVSDLPGFQVASYSSRRTARPGHSRQAAQCGCGLP